MRLRVSKDPGEAGRLRSTPDAESAVRLAYPPPPWTWRGRRWAALGGAVSEDVDTRIPGVEWWPEETITIAETQRLLTGCPRLGHVGPTVDVLLTHDVPARIKTASRFLLSPQLAARVAAHRQLLGEAVTAVQPRLLVHGHLHLRHSTQLPLPAGSAVAVEGLASDDQRDSRSWAVLDLTTPPYAPTPEPAGPTAWFAPIRPRRRQPAEPRRAPR